MGCLATKLNVGAVVKHHREGIVKCRRHTPGEQKTRYDPHAVPLDATRCAVQIQQRLNDRNTGLPSDRKMEFRIGIHMGDVMVEGERIYGDGINIASRLERLAHAGDVCISGAVHEQVRHKLELQYQDLGEQRIKNLPDPVRVYRLRLSAEADARASGGAVVRGRALVLLEREDELLDGISAVERGTEICP